MVFSTTRPKTFYDAFKKYLGRVVGNSAFPLVIRGKVRNFAPEFTNVDRFGLLATTVKNAKTTKKSLIVEVCFCQCIFPNSFPILY